MADIRNFYKMIKKNDENEPQHPIFELPFRMLIIGASGSGKTNAALNIIKSLNGFFVDVSVITKNANEPLYELLQAKLKDLCHIYEGVENSPPLDEFDKKDRHLIIFDDLVNESERNQKPVIEYFIRARKQNCTVMYLSQSFYQTPILIRRNINFLVIVKLSSVNDLARIIKECALTETKDQLMGMYKEATSVQMRWLMIDMKNTKYYYGFEEFV